MLRIFGVEISGRSILLSLVHTVIEVVTMVLWLRFAHEAFHGSNTAAVAVVILTVGLAIEHIVALSPGKQA